MKKKLITLILSALAATSLFALTACGNGSALTETANDVSSFEETVSAELELNSESLGIYVQDTDNDGIPDKVVDKDGNDLSHLYTLKADGIYEGEALILPIEHIQAYIAGEENTEVMVEPIAEEPQASESDTNNTNAGGQTNQNNGTTYAPPSNGNVNTGGNNGGSTNTGTATKPQQQQQQTAAPAQTQPIVHQPIYRQQWVVDQAAWSEEVPVYGTQVYDACNGCGIDITSDPWGHIEAQLLAGNMKCGGYHTEYRQVQTGTKTVYHEEQGHYENVLVCGGCTGNH